MDGNPRATTAEPRGAPSGAAWRATSGTRRQPLLAARAWLGQMHCGGAKCLLECLSAGCSRGRASQAPVQSFWNAYPLPPSRRGVPHAEALPHQAYPSMEGVAAGSL
jgi:hypothetical protein